MRPTVSTHHIPWSSLPLCRSGLRNPSCTDSIGKPSRVLCALSKVLSTGPRAIAVFLLVFLARRPDLVSPRRASVCPECYKMLQGSSRIYKANKIKIDRAYLINKCQGFNTYTILQHTPRTTTTRTLGWFRRACLFRNRFCAKGMKAAHLLMNSDDF